MANKRSTALLGTGVHRICAVAAASTASEMIQQVGRALRETHTIELRLDWLGSDTERTRLLVWLKKVWLKKQRGVTFLATCRREEGGGKFTGDIDGELYWLMQAREAGCQWCDVEVETLRKLPDKSIKEYAVPRRVLLSVHDFHRTPSDLPKAISTSAHGEADAVKIAATARNIADSVRLLESASHSRNFVAVPMGEIGLPARILALREGSALAYASIEASTAPGQVSLKQMKHLYRAHKLTRKSGVYGVIANPVAHSLSPLLHNTGFATRRIDAVYLPFLVKDLRDFLKAVPDFRICGFSVTIPHKETILKHLDECEPLAAEIGAVNTVLVRSDGSLYGCNTDYLGVLRALNRKLKLSGSRVLIFGAGGSARAAAFALKKAGAAVVICARRENAAKTLARVVDGEVIARKKLRSASFDAILNATPVGMHPNDKISPLEANELNCRLVMDLIYRPLRTQLLKITAQKGITAVSGVEMFLAQGFAQWEMFTGKRAPEAAMRRAAIGALQAEEKSGKNSGRVRP